MRKKVLLVICFCMFSANVFCGNGTYQGEAPNQGMSDSVLEGIVQTGNAEQSQTAEDILESRHRQENKKAALEKRLAELMVELDSINTNHNTSSDLSSVLAEINQVYSDLTAVNKEIAAAQAANTTTSANEIAENNSATPGDPVKASIGTYIQNETDITSGLFEVKRKYESDGAIVSSIGRAWTFNLDQRLILGIEPKAAEKYSMLLNSYNHLQSEVVKSEQKILSDFHVSSLATGANEISAKFSRSDSVKKEAEDLDCSDVSFSSVIKAAESKREEIQNELNMFNTAINNLKKLKSEAANILAEAQEYKRDVLDKCNARKVRNKKVMFSGSLPFYEETGLNTISLIDEDGTPHVLYEMENDATVWKNEEDNKYKECIKTGTSYKVIESDGYTKLFDEIGFIVQLIDRNGNSIHIKRSSDEKIEYVETSFGEKYGFTYSGNYISKITNERSPDENVAYFYEGNKLTVVKDTDGDTVIIVYDTDGRMNKLEKSDGSFIKFNYEEQTADGKVLATATINEEGYPEHFKYYRSENHTDYLDHDGNATSYWYDDKHRTVKEIRPDGTVINNEYDDKGNLCKVNENGNIIFYRYDERGNKTEAVYGDGSRELWSYNQYNQIKTYTNRKGDLIEYIFDVKGNITEYKINGETVYSQRFNTKGQLEKRIVYGQTGIVTDYSYDVFGNLQTVICGGIKTEYEYDNRNRITRMKVAGKVVKEYEYSEHKTVMKEYNGLETTYITDGRKDLIQIIQKDIVKDVIHETKIKYDKRHLPLRVYSGNGENLILRNSYLYTPEGKLKAEINHGNISWIKLYSYKGGVIKEVKQFMVEATVKNAYDENDLINLMETAGESIYIEQYNYQIQNGNKKLLTVTDGLGSTNLFEYDNFGNLVRTTDGNGEIKQKIYSLGYLQKEQTSHGGWYEYDYKDGVLISVSENGSSVASRIEYYPNGNIKKQTDRYGKVTSYDYDSRGRVSSIQSEARKVWYEYDSLDRVIKQVIGNSLEENTSVYYETYEYTENGRKVTVTKGGKYKTVNELDAFGNIIKQIDGNDNERSFVYDSQNQMVESYDPYNNKTSYEYNALGTVNKVTLPDEAVTEYEYNYMGQLEKVSDDCGIVYEASYDKAGRLVKERNRADSEKSFDYDAAGRVKKVLCGGEVVESYTYGPNNRTVTVKDGNGNDYLYNYDGFGRLVNERNRIGLEQYYYYDEEGKLKSQTNFDSSTTTINYSSDRTVRTVYYSNGSQNRFVYNSIGNIIEAENAYGKTIYQYDQGGYLIFQKDVTTGEEIRFEYDDAGNRIRLYSSNRETKYTYGKSNEVKEIFDNKQRISIKLSYDKNGREVLRKFGNGTEEATLYDKASRVTVKMQKSERGELMWGEGYVYGTDGKRTSTVDNLGRVTLYEYNKKGQLETVYYPYSQELSNKLKEEVEENGLPTAADIGENKYLTSSLKAELVTLMNAMQYGLSYNLTNLHVFIKENYTYDKNGNSIEKITPFGKIEYTYDKENCLFSSGSQGQIYVTYTYDKMGNLLTEESPNKTTKYAYNSQNRLIYCEVTDKSKKEYAQTTYAYDAFGRRIIVQDKGEAALHTLYDGLTFDVIKQSPVFENGMFTDLNQSGIRWGNTGRPTGDRYRYLDDENVKDSNRYIYIEEGNYKTTNNRYRGERTTVTVNGTLAAQTSYDYGTEYFSTDLLGSVRTSSDSYGIAKSTVSYDVFGSLIEGNLSDTTGFGYLGKQNDPTSNLYNYGYRDYKPQQARFTTIDPIRDGFNWFVYCNGDPVNFVDFLGLEYRDRYGTWRSTSDNTYKLEAAMNNHQNDQYISPKKVQPGQPTYQCDDYDQAVLKESELYDESLFAGDSQQKNVADHIDNAKKNGVQQNQKDNAPNLTKADSFIVFMADSPEGLQNHTGILRKTEDGKIYFTHNSSNNASGGVSTKVFADESSFQDWYDYNSFYYEKIKTK